MPYEAEISRRNPTLFVFLIDQSGSMADSYGGTGGRKCDEVANAVNRLLQNLVLRCVTGEGVLNRYSISLLSYGDKVRIGFPASQNDLIPLNVIADNPTRVEEKTRKTPDGSGGLVDETFKMPVWFDPKAEGGTPMRAAFTRALDVCSQWVRQHPDSYPPTVFNITDGESTDGDPSDAANQVRSLAGNDGNALVFNIHISSAKANQEIIYPSNTEQLPNDKFASMLFNMSSILPKKIRDEALKEGYTKVNELSRGFAFNADLVSFIQFLDIGTRPVTGLR